MLFFAFITNLIDFMFFYGFKCLFYVLFSSKLRVADSSPSLLLSPFEVPFLLPTSFVVGPVMKIDTTVTKWTVARVMPIFTESEVIIKPTGISYGAVDS